MILAIMGTAATSGSIPYWMGVTSGAGAKAGRGIATTTNDLIVAASATPSNSECQIFHMSKGGGINWQRSLATSGTDLYYGSSVDSSGNVYAVGMVRPSGNDECVIAKYNSTGTIQWQRYFSGGTNSDRFYSVAATSGGDTYACGYNQQGTTGINIQLNKYNTSGTIQWQRELRALTGVNEEANDVALDSTGDPYVAGWTAVSTIERAMIAKWNAAGTHQWVREIQTAQQSRFAGTCFDSTGAMYAAGHRLDGSLDYECYLVKFATTPSITWQRSLDSASTDEWRDVDTDSADNVYVAGYTTSGSVNQGLIAKYNSSGTLQWQRTISQASNVLLLAVHVDASDVVYVAGYSTISGVQQMFVARLPNDGTLTGTYSLGGVSHTYGASSLTGATPTDIIGTPSLNAYDSTYTDSAGTATDASTSITFTTLAI